MNLDSTGSYYELLGVAQSADSQALKKAFHRLSKTLHPDTTSLPAEEAAKKFRQLYEAYEFLSDPLKRQLYDKKLSLKNYSLDSPGIAPKISKNKVFTASPLRPLSGGELFSLMLLATALLISLLLGVGFALLNGRDLQVRPSWLKNEQSLIVITSVGRSYADTTSFNYPFKPTFFRCP